MECPPAAAPLLQPHLQPSRGLGCRCLPCLLGRGGRGLGTGRQGNPGAGPHPPQAGGAEGRGRAGACGHEWGVAEVGRPGGWQLPSSTKSLMLESPAPSLSTRMLLGGTARVASGASIASSGVPPHLSDLRGQGQKQDRAAPAPRPEGDRRGSPAWGHGVAPTASGAEAQAWALWCYCPGPARQCGPRGQVADLQSRCLTPACPASLFSKTTLHSGPGG